MAFVPSTKQSLVIDAMLNHRMVICSGAVRSSKTASVCIALPLLIQKYKDQNIVISSKTYATCEENILSLARKMYGANAIGTVVNHNSVIIFGKKCLIRPYSNLGAVGKIQGLSAALAVVDEISLCPEEFYDMLKSRLDQPESLFVATCNPVNPQNYVKARLIDKAVEDGLDLVHFHFTIFDNPFLDSGVREELINSYKRSPLFYKRNILGEWCSDESLAYYAFNPEAHTCKFEDLDLKLLKRNIKNISVGVDGASINDSTVFCPVIETLAGHLFVLPRLRLNPKVNKQMTDTEQVDSYLKFKQKLENRLGFDLNVDVYAVDCAATNLALTLDNNVDCPVVRITKKDQQKTVGVVNRLFNANRITIVTEEDWNYDMDISYGSDSLFVELGTVTVKDDPTGKYTLDPKVPNDASDALRYDLSYLYSMDIADLTGNTDAD